jgi:hypothetical protein
MAGLALIFLLAVHGARSGGFPPAAQATAMSSVGAESAHLARAEESPEMKRLMAIGAAAAMSAGVNAQHAVQWRVEDGGNGHWYCFDQEVLHWAPHRDRAMLRGAHLATVTSSGERAFLESILFIQENDIWLGGQSNWPAPMSWVTGEPFDNAIWCPAGFNPGGGYAVEICGRAECINQYCWNIEGETCLCWPGNKAVYEWSADCDGDGIVDFGQIRAGELADSNANNIPDCCEIGMICGCSADTNRDGTVDGIDLATVLTRWGQSAAKFPEADCNRDGVIDGSDLAIVLGSWGACP